ncbi:hypothetical protein P152DRAFT_298195 [Eremomyces bilateralis CBS 781.70]|uniref:F-box domain-containing protein n=1 Tax=Eremomyces bilateralis CBS 781.70 TaxID=1392243 RepID=A0A6G1G762_9PEZI|nr:uncharacterized protein P152DRAFT_298195 [Eremomyces bilateralis CBS 781.70]KAF1813925.1 hypothetical protein P152DRAFT_298195 [Eremomyces bilateralis CBS 781.70]
MRETSTSQSSLSSWISRKRQRTSRTPDPQLLSRTTSSMAAFAKAATTTGSGRINHLPTELLLQIFNHLRSSSARGSLLNCMCVSRQWNELCLPILHNHVVVAIPCQAPDRYHPQMETLAASGGRIDWSERIASFTVLLDPCSEAYAPPPPTFAERVRRIPSGVKKDHEGFEQAAAALTRMKNITTLSIKTRSTGVQIPWCPQEGIFKTISATPSTVVNLEIDTLSADTLSTRHIHLCNALAPLLPQLKLLRLRIRFLCDDLFSALEDEHATSCLEKISIRLGYKYNSIYYPLVACTKRCGSDNNAPPYDARIALARKSRELYEGRKFPNITAFTFVDRQDLFLGNTFLHSRAFKVYDVIENQTLTIPWRAMPSPPAGTVGLPRYYAMRIPEGFLRGSRLDDELAEDRTEIITNDLEALGSVVERQEWYSAYGEARLPLSVLYPRTYSRALLRFSHPYSGLAGDEPNLIRPSQYREWLDTITEPIWLLESATGAKVLESRVNYGFEDTEPGMIEMPEGLRYEYDEEGATVHLMLQDGVPGIKIQGW